MARPGRLGTGPKDLAWGVDSGSQVLGPPVKFTAFTCSREEQRSLWSTLPPLPPLLSWHSLSSPFVFAFHLLWGGVLEIPKQCIQFICIEDLVRSDAGPASVSGSLHSPLADLTNGDLSSTHFSLALSKTRPVLNTCRNPKGDCY